MAKIKRPFELKAFNSVTFAATETAWKQDAADGMAFPPEVEQLMDWARGRLGHKDGDSVAFGVFGPGNSEAFGIAEVVMTRRSKRDKWIKLLRVRLRPQLDNKVVANEPQSVSEALSVYADAARGLFLMKNEHEASILKLYGRNQAQLAFLTVVGEKLRQSLHNEVAKMEGNFLVIKTPTTGHSK